VSEKGAGSQHDRMADVMPVSEVTEFPVGCEVLAPDRDSERQSTEDEGL
jgi:hypothetical protein